MNYNNPFIKVLWQDTPENFSAEKMKRVKTYFQEKYNTKHVQVITKTFNYDQKTKLQSLDISENITDHQYQKKLMKEFISENKIDIKWDLIDRLDNKVNAEIVKDNENKVRYNKWSIKKINFSNFLSFGDDNVIDFENLNGITVIESNPKNFGGKSTSTVDLLMFLFFNTTTKTKTNIEIFNRFSNKDYVIVKGLINIDGSDYIIERTINRKKGKTGEYSVTNKLEFYKCKENGEIENLAGEQRRETETFITSAIGTEEDFLSTILTTGYNLEELIESKPTARGQVLTRFIGLENLKIKEEICKSMHSEWSKKLVSNTYNLVQLENENQKYYNDILLSEQLIDKLSQDLLGYKEVLKNLELRRDTLLSQRNNDIDGDLSKINPLIIKNEIDGLSLQKTITENKKNQVVVKEPKTYYSEDEHDKIKDEINKIKTDLYLIESTKKGHEKMLKNFEEGSICPTCKRALEDVDHTDEINNIKKLINDSEVEYEKVLLTKKTLDENEKVFNDLKKEYDEYERNKLVKEKLELEIDQKQLEIDAKNLILTRYQNNKKKLDDNQKIDGELIGVRTKIDTTNADIKVCENSIEKNKNYIDNYKQKITTNNELITKIKSETDINNVFKIYLTIFGKNGISKVILRNMIPVLNLELHRLLMDSCHFILELNINDKNEVDFIMIDTETRITKPLNSGSGYERTISSLALRSVLTKVSSLPKPNIVVMDEVFGKIADENLEMVGEFFKKIKNYFEHIFVISHNTLIRNWSDNIIMVKKEENISSIDFVNTKI